MDSAVYIFARKEKEDKTMNDSGFAKNMVYMGAGCGVILFAVFGLLPGSYLGGVMGLNVAGLIFGLPVTSGLFSRLVVAASMVMGVMVSGIMFITAAATGGWLISTVIASVTAPRKGLVQAEHK
jgi:hypothetical protein